MKNFLLAFPIIFLGACVNKSETKPKEETSRLTQLVDSITRNSGLTKTEKNEILLNKGYYNYFDGRFEEASIIFNACYSLDSSRVENQYAFAQINSINGNYKKAINLFSNIIQKDSIENISAYGSKMMLYMFDNEEQKAQKMVSKMLNNKNDVIKREAYSVSAVLKIMKDSLNQAIDYLKLRIPLSVNNYDEKSHRLEHPYWDYHLIANIFLNLQLPDSARYYSDKGFTLIDPKEKERTVRVIQEDRTYFKSLYLLQKKRYEASYKKLMEDFDRNQNGLGAIWAKLLIDKNLPDSSLVILDDYCRNGYFSDYIKGLAYSKKGDSAKADSIFKKVLNHHQVGEWYWQHEYALICNEIRNKPKKQF